MKLFKCQHCDHPLYFENTLCLNCGSHLGFLYPQSSLVALTKTTNGLEILGSPGMSVKYCSNYQFDVCNWLINGGSNNKLCEACELNNKIPNLDSASNIKAWRSTENAKHRLLYSLHRLRLPLRSKAIDPINGLAFEFLEDQKRNHYSTQKEGIKTGHVNGVITLNIAEADSVHREMTRELLKEDYRTLIGHFRHEIGHYYWDQLVKNSPHVLEDFRRYFGDEREDYGHALNRYYAFGPKPDWNQHYITAYASSHPWEDWAESWAHYLHFVDTLETAFSFGVSLQPNIDTVINVGTTINFDPYEQINFDAIIAAYLPLTFAMNSINRSMGIQDLYPFVTHQLVLDKMKFIHHLIHNQR